MAKTESKSEAKNLRMRPAQLRAWTRQARRDGKSLNVWIEWACDAACEARGSLHLCSFVLVDGHGCTNEATRDSSREKDRRGTRAYCVLHKGGKVAT